MGVVTNELPENIRNSKILTEDNFDLLVSLHEIPAIDPSFDDHHLKQIIQYYSLNPDEMEKELHFYAKKLLEEGKINEAWQVLLSG
jgi:hypothetical protein